MNDDNLEFQISQYIDGMLAPAERAALESRLESDAVARETLQEYRRLDSAVRAMPLPAVRWNALAASISSVVGEVADAAEAASRRTTRQRQPSDSSFSLRIQDWLRSALMPLALAASVLVATVLGLDIFLGRHVPSGIQTASIQPPPVAVDNSIISVDASTARPTGQAVELVAIGPEPATTVPPVVAQQYDEDDDVVSGSSHAIASGAIPVHDTGTWSSYDME